MTRPLYHDIAESDRLDGKTAQGHAGLWFDRFVPDWHDLYRSQNQEDKTKFVQQKTHWITDIAGTPGALKSVGNREQLIDYNLRMMELVSARKGRTAVFKTDWHFITGMGLPHPVENGFAWHPTLGTPYLCGAAVKGLVRAWMEHWQQAEAALILDWFGAEDGAGTGNYIFFDAIPVTPPQLTPDIMTPHMDKWYEKGDQTPMAADTLPGDWHDPVPVQFLAVKKASFLFGIAPRTPAAADDMDKVFAALTDALGYLGAGAKTAAGYGIMSENPEEYNKYLREPFKQIQKIRQARQEEARIKEEKRLAQLAELAEEQRRAGLSEAQRLREDLQAVLSDLEQRKTEDRLIAREAKELLRQQFNRIFKAETDWQEADKTKARSLIENALQTYFDAKTRKKLTKKLTDKFPG